MERKPYHIRGDNLYSGKKAPRNGMQILIDGWTERDEARRDKTEQGKARQGKTRQGRARQHYATTIQSEPIRQAKTRQD